MGVNAPMSGGDVGEVLLLPFLAGQLGATEALYGMSRAGQIPP